MAETKAQQRAIRAMPPSSVSVSRAHEEPAAFYWPATFLEMANETNRNRRHPRTRDRAFHVRAGERVAAATREGTAQDRLHQAHGHGAARHRVRERLFRGRGPVRHARTTGELEGGARSRDHRRA